MLDAVRVRPAGAHLRHRRSPPVAPDTEALTFEPADQYAIEAERFAAAVLGETEVPTPPSDGVANMQVIERLFAAAV